MLPAPTLDMAVNTLYLAQARSTTREVLFILVTYQLTHTLSHFDLLWQAAEGPDELRTQDSWVKRHAL